MIRIDRKENLTWVDPEKYNVDLSVTTYLFGVKFRTRTQIIIHDIENLKSFQIGYNKSN